MLCLIDPAFRGAQGVGSFNAPKLHPPLEALPRGTHASISAAQESRGHAWIPQGMFSTFLEIHCGFLFCGKGLGTARLLGEVGMSRGGDRGVETPK